MITLRLDTELEKSIQEAAKLLGLSKSELIRRSIESYLQKLEKPSAWELGSDLFGKHSSGKGNLSEDCKAILREKLRTKTR